MIGLPAVRPDVVVEFLGALHFPDDGRAGVLAENKPGKEEQEFIAPEDLSAVGDDAEAVGVAVIGNARIGLFLHDEGLQFGEIFRDGGVGKMVGEAAVRFTVDIRHPASEALEQGQGEQSPHAVAAVHDDLQVFADFHVMKKIVLVGLRDVVPALSLRSLRHNRPFP